MRNLEYVVTFLPESSDNWLIRVRGQPPSEVIEIQDEELVEYANCRDEIEAVKRYINRFGPPYLAERPVDEYLYGETRGRWKSLQLDFRTIWEGMAGVGIGNAFTVVEDHGVEFPGLWESRRPWKKAQAEGEFQLTEDGLIFLAKTHWGGLIAKLLLVSAAGKLRKCLNPDCEFLPYFIATHGKVEYCSKVCGNWGQRQAKLRYWRESQQGKRKASEPKSAQGENLAPIKIERRRKNVTHEAR
jgi:hypothetical protein